MKWALAYDLAKVKSENEEDDDQVIEMRRGENAVKSVASRPALGLVDWCAAFIVEPEGATRAGRACNWLILLFEIRILCVSHSAFAGVGWRNRTVTGDNTYGETKGLMVCDTTSIAGFFTCTVFSSTNKFPNRSIEAICRSHSSRLISLDSPFRKPTLAPIVMMSAGLKYCISSLGFYRALYLKPIQNESSKITFHTC
jgi:hypothetical protein